MTDRSKLSLRASFDGEQRYSSNFKVVSISPHGTAIPLVHVVQKSAVGIADDDSVSSYDSDGSIPDADPSSLKSSSKRSKKSSRSVRFGESVMQFDLDKNTSEFKTTERVHSILMDSGHNRMPSDSTISLSTLQRESPTPAASSALASRTSSTISTASTALRRTAPPPEAQIQFPPFRPMFQRAWCPWRCITYK
jgi:hypothetical protein